MQIFADMLFQTNRFEKSVFKYEPFSETSTYQILKRKTLGRKIVAAYGSVVVLRGTLFNTKKLFIYPNYRNRIHRYSVELNSKNFPGLIENSSILCCLLLPYIRKAEQVAALSKWRLVVITDKCQVYHNFPSRDRQHDGFERARDIKVFEESAVWDLPGRRYPSQSERPGETEIYLPCLPDASYQYHPMLNSDSSYDDKFGNGGFGKTTRVIHQGREVEVSRFYFPIRKMQANSFCHMGGYEPDHKLSLLGTYCSNTDCGVRTVVFASSDGGRNWYAKYEFGDYGEYTSRQDYIIGVRNYGNSIDTSRIEGEYVSNSYSMVRRKVIAPTGQDKQPDKLFAWGSSKVIESISKASPAMATTCSEHGLANGDIVAVISNGARQPGSWEWMLNDGISSTSGGNGLLFKVDVIDTHRFNLYEFVASPENNITCRHIHHINRVKDGWIIGTGEIYPNGWLLYMQMKEADTFSAVDASGEFKIIRLNSAESSVQRTQGMIMCDDEGTTLIFASDHDRLLRQSVQMPTERSEQFERSSTGIFRGKLVDIDDLDEFQSIYEAKEPAYFFKQLGPALVFSGQRGEFALSFDRGSSWHTGRLDRPLIYYHGQTYTYFVVDDYIIRFK